MLQRAVATVLFIGVCVLPMSACSNASHQAAVAGYDDAIAKLASGGVAVMDDVYRRSAVPAHAATRHTINGAVNAAAERLANIAVRDLRSDLFERRYGRISGMP